jgi:hypothetical protein
MLCLLFVNIVSFSAFVRRPSRSSLFAAAKSHLELNLRKEFRFISTFNISIIRINSHVKS